MIYLTILLIALGFGLYYSLEPSRNYSVGQLGHLDLLILSNEFGYPMNYGGLCHGFTLNWASFVLSETTPQFYESLNFIKKEKTQLLTQEQQVREKLKKLKPLNAKEEKIQKVRPLLESVYLAQDPDNFPEIYPEQIAQPSTRIILNFLSCNSQKAAFTRRKTYGLDSEKAVFNCFKQLETLCKTISPLALLISNDEHSLGAEFTGEAWLLLNSNKLYVQNDSYPYQRLSCEALSRELYSAFNETATIIFTIDFISTPANAPPLKTWLKQANENYPIDYHYLNMENCRQISFLNIALYNGDFHAVKNYLALSTQRNLDLEKNNLLLFIAIFIRDVKLVRLLLASPYVENINSTSKKTGRSPLNLASGKGCTAIVAELLQQKEIKVDLADNQGLTPLMRACMSDHTRHHEKLFFLLLNQGASLYLRNKRGETALDLALTAGHQLAIDILEKHIQSQGLKRELCVSHARIRTLREWFGIASGQSTQPFSLFAIKATQAPQSEQQEKSRPFL